MCEFVSVGVGVGVGVGVWECGSVGVWEVWECGSVGVWECGCGCGCFGNFVHSPSLLVTGLASVVVVFSLLLLVSQHVDRDSHLIIHSRLAWLKVPMH